MNGLLRHFLKLPLNWIVFVALETFAQISLKLAAVVAHPGSGLTAWLFALVSNHWFQASIAADIANFFIWMSILRRHDLSLAVPLSSLSYFTVIALSTILLHEAVTPLQLVGLGAVGIGIILIAGPDSGDTGDIAKDPVSDANIVRSDAANIFIQEAVKDGAP